MRSSFPTREELSTKNLTQLRLIDIRDKDEEDLVQEYIDARVKVEPLPQAINKEGIPYDIKSPEEEAKYQKLINERVAKAKGLSIAETTPEASETIPEDPQTEDIEEPILEEKEESEVPTVIKGTTIPDILVNKKVKVAKIKKAK